MYRATQVFLATVAILCTTVSSVSAQETIPQDRRDTQTVSPDAGQLDSKTTGANIRVSQLLGLNIQNAQGESVGEINDIVLDSRTGKVRYAAVTYGGFLGMGDKLFAVPFEAFKVQVDADEVGDDDIDSDDYVMVLNVTKQQLQGQQGFDQDHWPNMADSQWAADLDKRYGVQRSMDDKTRLMREIIQRDNQ